MQLMTFNSLLMFDIVFIFFLFLVCVTCLVYYLPPRELSAAGQPQLAEEEEHCHDHCHRHYHHHHHLHPCCDEPAAAPVVRVRECAAAARRISGGGTPTGSLPDLSEKPAKPGDNDAEVSRGVLNFPHPAPGASADGERREGSAWQCRPPTPDPLRSPEFPLHQSYNQHLRHQDREEQLDVLQRRAHNSLHEGGFPLGYALTDIRALCPRTATLPGASADGREDSSHPLLPDDFPDFAGFDGSNGCQPHAPLACTCYCAPAIAVGNNQPSLLRRPSLSSPRSPPPSSAVVNYRTAGLREEQQQQQQQQVQFVQIQIERHGNVGSSRREGEMSQANMPMPACCYVRAKSSDIKECSGPIHDV